MSTPVEYEKLTARCAESARVYMRSLENYQDRIEKADALAAAIRDQIEWDDLMRPSEELEIALAEYRKARNER